MSDVRLRGSAFASSYLCFVRLYGKETAAQLLAQIRNRDFAAVYASDVQRDTWYRMQDLIEVWETMEDVGGDGTVRRVAREMAIEDLNSFLKTILSAFGTPAMLASRASHLWNTFYGEGDLVLVESAPNLVRLELRDYPVPHRLLCADLAGWMEGALNQTRVKGARIEHPQCRACGAARCEFVARW